MSAPDQRSPQSTRVGDLIQVAAAEQHRMTRGSGVRRLHQGAGDVRSRGVDHPTHRGCWRVGHVDRQHHDGRHPARHRPGRRHAAHRRAVRRNEARAQGGRQAGRPVGDVHDFGPRRHEARDLVASRADRDEHAVAPSSAQGLHRPHEPWGSRRVSRQALGSAESRAGTGGEDEPDDRHGAVSHGVEA